eukprot:3078894-Pleurochrysis_carterae.AAC.1
MEHVDQRRATYKPASFTCGQYMQPQQNCVEIFEKSLASNSSPELRCRLVVTHGTSLESIVLFVMAFLRRTCQLTHLMAIIQLHVHDAFGDFAL